MQTIEIPFGEWMPDAPGRKAGATTAKGVIAAEGAYRPIADAVTVSGSTITARCQGGRSFYDNDGNVIILVGDATKLYELSSGSTWTDRSGSTYTISSDRIWQFDQYGSYVVAVNGSDNAQVYDLAAPGNFADLSGSPPVAHQVGRVGQFLVLGDMVSPTLARSRVQWSAIGDITDWTTTANNQADYQDLSEDAGQVQGIFNVYETGVIFQARAITRMTYVGLPTIFQFDVVERSRGAMIAAHAMLRYGSMIFYPSDDGIFAWDGQQSIPISDNKVARYFINNLNHAYMHNTFAAFDFTNRAVVWAYPSGSNQTPDSLLIYSLKDNRWSYDDGFDLEMIFNTPSRGLSLEDMDTINASLDALPLSLDSPVYQSTSVRLGGFDTSHNFLEFTGSNRAATLETAEFQPMPGKRAYVDEVWPLIDSSDAITVSIGRRNQMLGDTLSYTASAAMNARGKCSLRANGRFLKGKLSIPASATWTHAEGLQVSYREGGRR